MSVESPGLEQALASGAAPEVLVPCDTAGLAEVALTLREHATVLEQAAGSLGRVEVTSWRGDASTRFTDTISVEPGRWLAAADGFIAAAVALEGFLTGMPAARDTARTATTLYLQYKTLVAALTAGQPAGPPPLPDTGNGSVRDRIAIGARLDQLTTATGNAATLASRADALRLKAIDLLAAARAAVSAAGDLTAHSLDQAAATAPQARRFFEANIRPAGIIGAGHTALDFAGMIPVLGAVPDAMNAVWFGSEGDTTNAALSVAGMLPLLGDAIIGGRVVRGGVEAADAMAQRALRRLDDGGLGGHEVGVFGHTLARHSGKSDAYLLDRITPPNAISKASTYADDAAAERYTYASIEAHQLEVAQWLAGPKPSLPLSTRFDHPVGLTMLKIDPGATHNLWGTIVRLTRDASMPNGYRIVTSYPD